ncbi:MAG: hypothetical protein EXQ91_00690 [Alphaproteobacteria bacterium]|nr:hypothetical protein [Alphaproteobacteria bacterium]
MRLVFAAIFFFALGVAGGGMASEGEKPLDLQYVTAPPAPVSQTQAQADAKSVGCMSCHTQTDQKTMHANPAIVLGCVDCHGGDAAVRKPEGSKYDRTYAKEKKALHHDDEHGKGGEEERHGAIDPLLFGDAAYVAAMQKAHVMPRMPNTWGYPRSRNPERAYTLFNKEAPEYIRFVNPSDYRIAREACGACHLPIIQAAERHLMSTGAMLFGGGAYNNGILPFKNYLLGEAYTRDGQPAAVESPGFTPEMKKWGVIEKLVPLPTFQTVPPGDVFRVFERGGRNIVTQFPEIGLPNSLGQIQRLEEPGRPDLRQSMRGPGTGLRIAVPVLNIHRTRLNDPFMWFMGTNDQPGDYRTSGCGGCHIVYANDRDPRHSGPYSIYGHEGKTQTIDPTIPKDEEGHPIKHEFSRQIPTAQCMNCHMHQPNVFVNSFMGYTMWDYESDAPNMWPEKQQYPTAAEIRKVNERNPEEAAIRGKWADVEFTKNVWTDVNPKNKDTQFADYHGHGWNFRAIYKRDRKGNLLDADGKIVSNDDPQKFKKAVHMSSIHVDKGMHCIDCHFSQDAHGNGYIQTEVANAVEIDCADCHGTVDKLPSLITSGPAALRGGYDLTLIRLGDGRRRFEWRGDTLVQRSALWPNLEWEMSLVKHSVEPDHKDYNPKAARAKLMSKDTASLKWGPGVAKDDRAHKDDEMLCFTCHLSWTTSCAGCHLPIQANWKAPSHKYEGQVSRNYATYNPQVARDDVFHLGRHQTTKGNKIAPVRSSSGLVLSSQNINRERIYIQQQPVAASGHSAQAFAPHFPHTERKTETKTCNDCHLSESDDNNAIMANTLMFGTNFPTFVGANAWVAADGGIEGVQVTEYDEPQAVIGSYLHRYAYPDWYADHQKHGKELQIAHNHPSARAACLQLRGEYLYVAEGPNGFRAYDVASIANKGFSQRIVTAPFGPWGHDTHIATKNATCVALPSNAQAIHPARNQGDLMRKDNQEQPFHPIYDYAFVTDSEEGLIAVDVNTLSDGEPRNNFFTRALTWNENGVLNGARHITIAGYYFYIVADSGIVVLNMDDPMKPKVESIIPLKNGHSTALQFRYLFATDAEGFKVFDATNMAKPVAVPGAVIPLRNANRILPVRTYAYVAAGNEGLVIIDIEKPRKPSVYMKYTADGAINDARDVTVGTTNATLFAYVADGKNGLKVIQLTAPDTQPNFYGFSPEPKPNLIAWYKTTWPALGLSKGLERDRAVDETGGQIAVFGRLGSRPFSKKEMEKFYLDAQGRPWFTHEEIRQRDFVSVKPGERKAARAN